MASRRRRSIWRRLRRQVTERPATVAEVAVGIIAGTVGLWLMLSSGGQAMVAPERSGATAAQASADRARARADLGRPAEVAEVVAPRSDAAVVGFDFTAPRLAPPASELEPAEATHVGPEMAAREPLIARLRSLRLTRAPDHADEAGSSPPRRVAEAPGRINRAGLRGEFAVGWTASPARLPAAKPQEPTVAALPAPSRVVGREGVPAWVRNAAIPPQLSGRPMIAVVIDDLGLNRRNTAIVNQLPGPLTLAFLPYAGELKRQTEAARAAGHELLLHMPMEPVGQDWPGPDALLVSLGPDQFAERLRENLESFSGFVGLNNHMGSLLTADREHMALIMAELRRRDLLFLDSKTTARSIASAEAVRQGVPSVERDVFLDNKIDLEHVLRQLARTEQVARERGLAVAIGHPHDITISALRRWLPTLEQRGFALVPISTAVAKRNCSGEAPMPGCGSLRVGPAARTLAGAGTSRPS
jgi:polysaccharide deacetylase 2 family uncharacterized protein YibQ